MTQYKPAFFFGDEGPCTNAEVYVSFEDAEKSAKARFAQWTAPTSYKVIETEDPVTYRWDEVKGGVSLVLELVEEARGSR